MQVYNLEVTNTKLKSYRFITIIIVFLQVFYFIFFLFDPAKKNQAIINLAFVAVFVLYRGWVSIKNRTSFYLNEFIFFLLMILWVDVLTVAILNLVLFLLYGISTQKIIYSFSEDKIKLKRFPFTTYTWDSLENVILKDGILTLDFLNNKLIQLNVQEKDVEEIEFNQFAQRQLKIA